jgi:hypothetical protein
MKSFIQLTSILILAISLAACGDDAGSGGTAVGSASSLLGGGGQVVAIRLSGVVTLGDSSQAGVGSNLANRLGSSPDDQIVVLAIDAIGNSFATTTDASGRFQFDKDIGLVSNTSYAMIFIDMSSLQIIATMTNGSGQAGMLALPGDSELSEVVVDTDVRLASIIGAVNENNETINLQITSAASLDTDDDGQISRGEIVNALVATTQQGEIDTITSVSAFTFLGQVDTWSIAVDLEDDAFEDSVCEWIDPANAAAPTECATDDEDDDPLVTFLTDSAEMTLVTTQLVEGPHGSLVNAAKLLELTFLNRPFVDPESEFADIIDTDLVWEIGYISGSQADINDQASGFGTAAGVPNEYWTPYLDASLGNPPSRDYNQRMGMLGWSEYSFTDSETGRLIIGSISKDSEQGRFEVSWGGTSLPLNMPINTPFELTETETDEENGQIIETVVTSTVVVQLAMAGNEPALLEEGGGSTNLLPVFQLRFTQTVDEEDEVECSYIIARFGTEGDDPDENCDDMSDWLESFIDVRFGRINRNGNTLNIIDSTPAEIIANDSGEDGLPVDANGNLTPEVFEWLAYLHNNAVNIDYQFEPILAADSGDFGSFPEFWALIRPSASGSVLSPQPADENNNGSLLTMGTAPGLITINDLVYHATDSGVQFYVDMRSTDPLSGEDESVLDNPVVIEPGVDTSAATTAERRISITANIPQLPAPDSDRWLDTWESTEKPDGSGAELYLISQATVWVIMDADADLATEADQYEFPVDRYKVLGGVIE